MSESKQARVAHKRDCNFVRLCATIRLQVYGDARQRCCRAYGYCSMLHDLTISHEDAMRCGILNTKEGSVDPMHAILCLLAGAKGAS
eukprot:1160782-Pelagomonas_calceolata.AAC.2